MLRRTLLLIPSLALAAAASAQTGTLDQQSPAGGAWFNYDASSLVWQQQVRVGLAGQLEGFALPVTSTSVGTIDVRLRLGDGWSTGPAVWSGVGTTSALGSSTIEELYFDVTGAGLIFAAGDTFVVEIQGTNSGVGGSGSYVAPPGAPLYAENLYLGGPGCYADCGWRLGFKTWMLGGLGSAYCFGDGTGTLCPCGNTGGAGEGCANSSGAGAVVGASGTTSVGADDLAFTSDNMIPNQPALLFAADNAVNGGLGNPFGDGLRCAGGNVKRLGVRVPDANGTASWGPGLAAAGGWSAGDTRRFQTWYRDPGGPCGTAFNLSHGLELTFTP